MEILTFNMHPVLLSSVMSDFTNFCTKIQVQRQGNSKKKTNAVSYDKGLEVWEFLLKLLQNYGIASVFEQKSGDFYERDIENIGSNVRKKQKQLQTLQSMYSR